MFYMWDQNNTGGLFVVNGNVTHRVVIEAESYDQAEQKVFELGVYYNGCETGFDCECCGDRWYSGDEVNLKQGETIDTYVQRMADNYGWCTPNAYIYKQSGEKVAIFKNKG